MGVQTLISDSSRIYLGTNLDVLQNQSEATLTGWFNFTEFPLNSGDDNIIAFSTGTGANSSRMALRARNNGAAQFPLLSSVRRLDSDSSDDITGDPISLGVWHHAAVVCDWVSGTHRLLQDGVTVAFNNPAGWAGNVSNTPSQNASIGSFPLNIDWLSSAQFADLRVYRRALSVGEVSNIFQSRGRDRISDFYHRWNMSENSDGVIVPASSVIKDSGSGQRHGVGTNSPIWVRSPIHSRARRKVA